MQNLRACTKAILGLVEEKSGKSIQFMRDEKLPVLATLQMARNGAPFHVLRYRPSNDPLDYFVAFQAGFVLRLFENKVASRFDFSPDANADKQVEVLLATGQALGVTDKKALPKFAEFVAHWALLNLRSLPIGMRIDQWIASTYPELRDQQLAGIAVQQQQNMDVLAYKLGKLTIPSTLMGVLAAYALFADRLAENTGYSIPYEATGMLDHGKKLLRIWDETPSSAPHDCELVDRWALASGMTNWYSWISFKP